MKKLAAALVLSSMLVGANAFASPYNDSSHDAFGKLIAASRYYSRGHDDDHGWDNRGGGRWHFGGHGYDDHDRGYHYGFGHGHGYGYGHGFPGGPHCHPVSP